MNVSIVTVDPELARALLAANTRNRPKKRAHLEFLCRELREGRWRVNGDAIRIAADGTLLDGQHRLEMVATTGIPITSVIVTGLDKDTFGTIDVGARRSAGDAFAVVGEKNGKRLAAALVIVDDIRCGRTDNFGYFKTSNDEKLLLLQSNPNIRKSTKWGDALVRLAPPSVSIALHYLFAERCEEKADEFFQAVSDGADLAFDHPAYLLRKRLFDNATAKAKMSRRYMIALFIKAWNAFRSGQRMKNLRLREGGDSQEEFPAIR